MSEIICHIGLHKTATSTLQHQFFPQCPEVNLLTTLRPCVREFVTSVTRQDPMYFDATDAWQKLLPEISRSGVNLLSNESLSGPPYSGLIELGLDHRSAVLDNLKAAIPKARILLVLRRQDALARSLYRQYVKRGGTERIERFYGLDDRPRPGLMTLDRFNFAPFLDYLFEKFEANVCVLVYEQFREEPNRFLSKLCSFIGISRPGIQLKSENSTRLGATGMEVTRIANIFCRGLLNRGFIPRVPVHRYGSWQLVSPVELIHDRWPGRPAFKESSSLHAVPKSIWDRNKRINESVDLKYGLGLKEYSYY